MKKNRLIAFALSVSLLLGASACGKPAKTVSELIAEENAILDQHQELWTTALNSLDKDNLTQSTQSTNYADVLDLAIKNVKDQLSDEDYKTLTDDAAKVRKLEDQLHGKDPALRELLLGLLCLLRSGLLRLYHTLFALAGCTHSLFTSHSWESRGARPGK